MRPSGASLGENATGESQNAAPLAPGDTLGHAYRIVELLDALGLAPVFAADHIKSGRRVAVKVLPYSLVDDPDRVEALHQEAKRAREIEHSHIARLLEVGMTEQGCPFLVRELMKGESLSDRMRRQGRFPLGEAVLITGEIGSALAAAHRKGIVHDSLRPQVIFLLEMSGHGPFAKLIDLGLSRRLRPGARPADAPPPNPSTDQHALARIALHMLTGAPLESDARVVEPPPSEKSGPHLFPPLALPAADLALEGDLGTNASSRVVAEVLGRAMSDDPEDRYPDVSEFVNALVLAAGCSLPPAADAQTVAITLPAPAGLKRVRMSQAQRVAPTLPAVELVRRATPPRDATGKAPAAGISVEATLDALAAHARQELMLGDYELAVNYADSALRLLNELEERTPGSTRDSAKAGDIRALCERSLVSRLGGLGQTIRADRAAAAAAKDELSPERTNLLALIREGAKVEELLAASSLDRLTTLRELVGLVRLRICGVGRA